MSKPTPSRYRISVPHDDELVLEWVRHQHNLSLSVRHIVQKEIKEQGEIRDVFASDPEMLQRVGRPPESFDPSTRVNVPEGEERSAETISEVPVEDLGETAEVVVKKDKDVISSEEAAKRKRLAILQGDLDK